MKSVCVSDIADHERDCSAKELGSESISEDRYA